MRLLGTVAALALLSTASAHAAPDLGKMTSGELTAFTKAMPKGGELHNHVSGAIFPETFLKWAAEDGLCVDVAALAFRPPCTPAGDLKTAASVLSNDTQRSALYDSLTTREPGFQGRSGHDQFFSAFGRFGLAGDKRPGDELAEVLDGLARQNTFYLEAMVTPQAAPSIILGAKVGWKDGDLAAQKKALTEAGLDNLVADAMVETDAMEAGARQALKCGTPQARPGCQVTVRYLVQANRIAPLASTFAQLQLGVALIQADKRWVGLQLVAPEDHPSALANYRQHMKMVGFLTEQGRLAPAALHAGELSFKYATPAEMSFHIGEAVHVAGARRIGHGVALPHENGAEALAAEMAATGVLVEVNLTSNDGSLEVSGKDHPYAWLRQRGVPVSLSTDDAGILRIDLSHEYARAAGEGAGYADLKRSARNAIAFSFLAGDGLWIDPNVYRRPAKACAGQLGAVTPKPGPCADMVACSDKAREQWRHEWLLREFEKARK